MLSGSLILELQKLNRTDKLRALQLLIAELITEENARLAQGATYELVTPYGNEEAGQVLAEFVASSKRDEP